MCASLSPVTGPLLICWNLGVQQALRRIRWWSRAEAGWALVLSRARSSAVAMSASTHQAGVPSSLLGACLGMLTALSLFLCCGTGHSGGLQRMQHKTVHVQCVRGLLH